MRTFLGMAFATLCLSCALCAQVETKGYVVRDPNGKRVYLIPEVIAGKTVKAAMSLPGAAGARFAVQVGSFAVPANARRLERRLVRDGYAVSVVAVPASDRRLPLQVVSIVSLSSRQEADRVLASVRGAYGLEGIIVGPERSALAAH